MMMTMMTNTEAMQHSMGFEPRWGHGIPHIQEVFISFQDREGSSFLHVKDVAFIHLLLCICVTVTAASLCHFFNSRTSEMYRSILNLRHFFCLSSFSRGFLNSKEHRTRYAF